MALSLYKKQQSAKKLVASLDYDDASINSFLKNAGKSSGLSIDYYGDTVLYLTHLQALRSEAQKNTNVNNLEIQKFSDIIYTILQEGIPAGVSYIFEGD